MKWVLGIVGTLGIGGLIAIAVFAPALGILLWKGAVTATVKVSEKVFSTRPGCAIAALVAGLALGGIYGDLRARTQERAACHEAEVRAELEAVRADLAAAKLSEQTALQARDEIDAADKERTEKINGLETELAKRPAAARCLLDDAGRRRLRNIGPD